MNSLTECNTLETLLPWYVNGTLEQEDMVLVDQHLRQCEACRYSLEQEMQFAQGYSERARNLKLPTNTESGLNELLLTLPNKHPSGLFLVRARTALAASCAALLVGALILIYDPAHNQDFQTLSNPTGTVSGHTLQIVFQRETPKADIHAILKAVSASVSSGPTAQGVYRIQIPNQLPRREIGGLISRLRAEKAVLWVEAEVR